MACVGLMRGLIKEYKLCSMQSASMARHASNLVLALKIHSVLQETTSAVLCNQSGPSAFTMIE